MIDFKHITKKFADGTVAVDDLTLTVPKGRLMALIGPSGCGKTTTMKMINKLIIPSTGTISIDGKDIAAEDEVALRRNIGYVIQRIGLIPHMTIEENVSLVPRLKGWKKQDYQEKVDDLLELVGLDPAIYKKRYPLELSGGQQQRIGVIRALAGEPPIILMDEPFSALDPISREQLQDELKLLQQNIHKTIVFVTHDMEEALKIADEIVIMKEGKMEQKATPSELLQQPANAFVRSFVGEDRVKRSGASREQNPVSGIMKSLPAGPVSKLPSISASLSLQETARLMLEKKTEAVIVLDTNGAPVGFLEKNQLLKELAGLAKRG